MLEIQKRGAGGFMRGNAVQEIALLMRGECDSIIYAGSVAAAQEHFERLLELAQILLKVDFNDFTFEQKQGIIIALDASQRLAYGLCAKYGIELPPGTEPSEAWEALKEETGKGAMDFYGESGQAGADKIRFSTASPKSFTKALARAKAAQDPRAGWRVTGLTKPKLLAEHPKAKIHVTDGGSTIAIDNGDIVAVCVGPGDGKGGLLSGSSILAFAVKNGGNKLDSYTGNHSFYVKNGFEPVSWCAWEDQYANAEWLKVNGFTQEQWDSMSEKPKDSELKVPREPIVFYKYVGAGKVVNQNLEDFMNKVPVANDYDDAKEKRNKDMEMK